MTLNESESKFSWAAAAAAVGVPLAVYFILSIPLFDWIVDDAGISYAYARNLAQGHGLVSQPGLPPVEGYSNFLWVLLLAFTHLLGLFDPYVTVKLISHLLVGATFLLICLTLRSFLGSRLWPALAANLLLTTNASFLVWTNSGLENPLYAAMTALAAFQLTRFTLEESSRSKYSIYIGLTVAALALTRPDGLVYIAAFPVVALILLIGKSTPLKTVGGFLTRYAVATFGPLLSFLIFRLWYFGYPLPNTYYSKGGTTADSFLQLVTLRSPYPAKALELFESILGAWLWWVAPLLILSFLVLSIMRKRDLRPLSGPLSLLLLSLAAYLLLRGDWMREFRFATPFLVVLYPLLILVVYELVGMLFKQTRVASLIPLLCIAVFGIAAVTEHLPRYRTFSIAPTTPFEHIRILYAEKFDSYAERLGLQDASVLLPDVGGTLYYSRLRVIDLAGLCDRRIALTLEKDHRALADYTFGEVKPTFIQVHGWFTAKAKFDDDPRFLRDYVGINAKEDHWVKSYSGETRLSGDFVRREAIVGKEEVVDSLRAGVR